MTDRYAETDTWPNPPASQQPARPATLAASGPSRVLGEGSDVQEARVAAYAEAIRCAVAPLSEETTAEDWLEEARAVMAVADAERNEAYARGYQAAREHWKSRAESAERARDAALAEVTELRDRLADSEEEVRRQYHEAQVAEARLAKVWRCCDVTWNPPEASTRSRPMADIDVMVQAAMETDKCLAYAHALGLDAEVAREEIRAEQARASRRLRPFDWREVRRQIVQRAAPSGEASR